MKIQWLRLTLLLTLLALTACQLQIQPAPSPPAGESIEGRCIRSGVNTRLLMNGVHGYCLQYPYAYDLFYPNPDEMVIMVGSLLNVVEPRAAITVQDAAGRTAAQVADELVTTVHTNLPDWEIARSSLCIEGAEAIVLEPIPWQEPSRHVMLVHEGRLYQLTFSPIGAEANAAGQQTEALYTTVIQSFTFLPASTDTQC